MPIRRSAGPVAVAGIIAALSAAIALAARSQTPPPATWDFAPPPDDFRAGALLDLRSLNEATAGESGFVTVDSAGDFRLGSGKPARFWALNTTVGREKPWQPRPRWPQQEPALERHARFLAKRGVNMVRLHASLNPDPKAASLSDINERERDWIWRAVAAMKKEGIYSTISPYFALTAKFNPAWGLPGNPQDAHSLLFFEPKLQDAYRVWLRKLLAEKNPYTGIPLAQDPAVAVIQLQNEDSLLFWTVNNLKGEARAMLQRRYGVWLKAKYGTVEAAFAAWQGDRLPADDPAQGLADFHNLYELTQKRAGGRQARLADQLRFWAETMRGFNERTAEYLRKDLGCKQLLNAGNWKTADPAQLNDVERWTYTATDVTAVNRYFGGVHTGENSGWAVAKGQQFTSPSALKDPLQLPVALKQVQGRPMMVTESGWVMPAATAAEGPFLVSAYQCLTGVDAFFWFSTGSEQWEAPLSANGYYDSQAKWPIATPETFGTFPAAALIWRKALVKAGAPVVHEERTLDDLWQRRTTLIAEESGFDPNRDLGNLPPRSSVKSLASPLAFLCGPVEVAYGGDPARNRVADLAQLADPARKTVRSVTGELLLDYGKGFCTVNAPTAQGVAAFFREAGGSFKLADVEIGSENDYGTVTVVPLDGLPVKSSRRLLVQAGMRARPSGWRESPSPIQIREGSMPGFRIDDHGHAPWQVECPKLEVTVRNPSLKKATALDPNGYPSGAASLRSVAGGVKLRFPDNALYVVLE